MSHWLQSSCISILLFASACAIDSSDDFEDGHEIGMISIELPRDSEQESFDESTVNEGTLNDAIASEGSDDDAKIDIATSKGPLSYHNGPILAHVKIHPLFWNKDVRFISHLKTFYQDITRSSLFDMLHQYSGFPLQGGKRLSIGHGSLGNGFLDTRGLANLSNGDIQKELNRLFANGALPAPAANNYYPVHLPPNVSIVGPPGTALKGRGRGRSCVDFCGYHWSYQHNGSNVYYGVIVDSGCSICRAGREVIDRNDSTASHELIEAVTDPASALDDPAWFEQLDHKPGPEIADLCVNEIGRLVGSNGVVYRIQKEWSNRANKCVMR